MSLELHCTSIPINFTPSLQKGKFKLIGNKVIIYMNYETAQQTFRFRFNALDETEDSSNYF